MKNSLLALLLFATTLPAAAEVKTRSVEYPHGDVVFEGHLAWDDAIQGQRPGVLVIHEWWGLNDYARGRAEQLAGLGYVAFAVDMYGKGKVTEHPEEAGKWSAAVGANLPDAFARAQKGLDVLKGHELVDPARIAAIGYCFGGATVTHMAYANMDLKGVVSFHGSLPLPPEGTETVGPKILICHGAADGFIPGDHIPKFQQALDGLRADWQMIVYAGAKHSFTNPGADASGLGGLAYDADADRRSWQHMQTFFAEIFKE